MIPLTIPQTVDRVFGRTRWLSGPLALAGGYALWVILVRLLALTFITYFTITPTTRFQDISDAFTSNEVTLMGISALAFVAFQMGLKPLHPAPWKAALSRDHLESGFFPGFIRGAILAGTLVMIFLLAGAYRYLGYYIQMDEAPLELLNTLLRIGTLIALTYGEAYLFNFRLATDLSRKMPHSATVFVVALVYCSIKVLQFDLGMMHLITLFLISLSLQFRARARAVSPALGFARSAGFWAGCLIVFHPLLSLPIFGNDFSGILLVKYQGTTPASRLLTGGAGGPLSSFAFQLLLILDIGRSILKKSNRAN